MCRSASKLSLREVEKTVKAAKKECGGTTISDLDDRWVFRTLQDIIQTEPSKCTLSVCKLHSPGAILACEAVNSPSKASSNHKSANANNNLLLNCFRLATSDEFRQNLEAAAATANSSNDSDENGDGDRKADELDQLPLHTAFGSCADEADADHDDDDCCNFHLVGSNKRYYDHQQKLLSYFSKESILARALPELIQALFKVTGRYSDKIPRPALVEFVTEHLNEALFRQGIYTSRSSSASSSNSSSSGSGDTVFHPSVNVVSRALSKLLIHNHLCPADESYWGVDSSTDCPVSFQQFFDIAAGEILSGNGQTAHSDDEKPTM